MKERSSAETMETGTSLHAAACWRKPNSQLWEAGTTPAAKQRPSRSRAVAFGRGVALAAERPGQTARTPCAAACLFVTALLRPSRTMRTREKFALRARVHAHVQYRRGRADTKRP